MPATAALVAGWEKRFGPLPPMAVGGAAPLAITFPSTYLATRVYIALGADLTASHRTWNWLNITDRVRHDLGITVEIGRREGAKLVTPSKCTIKLGNRDSYLSRLNAFSPYHGLLTKNTPIWIQLDPGTGFSDVYFGHVNEWPPGWADASGNDSFVTITCSGVLRRLGKDQVLKSAMFRTMSGVVEGDIVPLAYVPFEDGRLSSLFGSGLPGGAPAQVSGEVEFAADSELAGSAPLATLSAGAVAYGAFPFYTNTNQWYLQIALKIDAAPAAETTYFEIDSPGGDAVVWRLYITPDTSDIIQFIGFNTAGTTTGTGAAIALDGSGSSNPSEADFYGSWWHFTLFTYIDPNDGLVYGGMVLTDNGEFSTFTAGAGSSTVNRQATAWRLYGRDGGVSAGHLGLFVDPAFTIDSALANAEAFDGYAGELAHERMRRLCREERVPFTTNAVISAAMGPQETGNLLALLRECEAADMGVLYEHEFGLAYQALSERYNQPVLLELDFAAGHHTGIPQPKDDDQRLVNKFTATRRNGSSATEEKEDGPLGTGPGGSGVFDDGDTVNVHHDGQLPDYAAWRVHLGTVDEYRWPALPFQLHRNPGLIPTWLGLPFGSRVTAANPPAQVAHPVDQFIEGFSMSWVQEAWSVTLFCSPASPYRIFVLEDTELGSIDSGSSALAVEAAAGATSLSVASAAGDLWSTDAGDYPAIVRVSGIDVTVTAVSGASSPQTFTVTGATVTKTLPANAAVELSDAAYLGI